MQWHNIQRKMQGDRYVKKEGTRLRMRRGKTKVSGLTPSAMNIHAQWCGRTNE